MIVTLEIVKEELDLALEVFNNDLKTTTDVSQMLRSQGKVIALEAFKNRLSDLETLDEKKFSIKK